MSNCNISLQQLRIGLATWRKVHFVSYRNT